MEPIFGALKRFVDIISHTNVLYNDNDSTVKMMEVLGYTDVQSVYYDGIMVRGIEGDCRLSYMGMIDTFVVQKGKIEIVLEVRYTGSSNTIYYNCTRTDCAYETDFDQQTTMQSRPIDYPDDSFVQIHKDLFDLCATMSESEDVYYFPIITVRENGNAMA
ncbi:hypothetical protein [Escherichia phage vB_EcoM_JNE01]|nr:hypothetical protein [Escherichia phage vB_EcoM_JNE01]